MTTVDDTTSDRALRFLFDNADIRGETVHLNDAYSELLAVHQYAPGVSELLGQFLAASVLLSATIKFDGKLVLQARSEGQIPLLMVECNSKREVRGIVRGAQEATGHGLDQLLPGGHLAITIDPDKGQRYQGVVPLVDNSLAHSLELYFQQSEQLDTRFWLASDGEGRAAGLLLQQLPAQLATDPDERLHHWEHATSLATTLSEQELLDLKAETLLHRLYHEESLRVFEPHPVIFHCSCSRERTRNALISLGPGEIASMLEDMGEVTVDCEFCNLQYLFSGQDLQDLLADNPGHTVH